MPLKYKKNTKRNFKKFVRKVLKKPYRAARSTKRIVALIKKVSLKNSETKYTHTSSENVNINHNSGYIVNTLLACQ